jgi:hypothetical protein
MSEPAPARLPTGGRRWLAGLVFAAGCASTDDRPAAWSYLHAAIVIPSCATASCHSSPGSQAGLDLSSRDGAYAFLTGRVCGAPPHPGDAPGNFVFPYAPERSRLMYLLRGAQTRVMPPDLPLPSVDVELFERWILDGAGCD